MFHTWQCNNAITVLSAESILDSFSYLYRAVTQIGSNCPEDYIAGIDGRYLCRGKSLLKVWVTTFLPD